MGCRRARGRFLRGPSPEHPQRSGAAQGSPFAPRAGDHEGASASPGGPTRSSCGGKKRPAGFHAVSSGGVAHPLVTHAHPRANWIFTTFTAPFTRMRSARRRGSVESAECSTRKTISSSDGRGGGEGEAAQLPREAKRAKGALPERGSRRRPALGLPDAVTGDSRWDGRGRKSLWSQVAACWRRQEPVSGGLWAEFSSSEPPGAELGAAPTAWHAGRSGIRAALAPPAPASVLTTTVSWWRSVCDFSAGSL